MVAKTNHINHQAGDRPVGRQDLQPTGQPPNQSWIAMQNHRFFSVKHHLLSSNFIWAMVSNSQTAHQNMSEPEAIEGWLAFPLNLIILSRTCC